MRNFVCTRVYLHKYPTLGTNSWLKNQQKSGITKQKPKALWATEQLERCRELSPSDALSNPFITASSSTTRSHWNTTHYLQSVRSHQHHLHHHHQHHHHHRLMLKSVSIWATLLSSYSAAPPHTIPSHSPKTPSTRRPRSSVMLRYPKTSTLCPTGAGPTRCRLGTSISPRALRSLRS